ncbi:hypothetical protein [Streptomyces johnsoniae]|uniref:Aromatic ring-opening dioxygenase LigA n=1 Tax=Streptomyces johnsoniae TaxID=3075532 RepID=A0ABU2S8V8_9ACTN|nr:hypothetical protein [Streptomyces sp. DSM 41886]MDT0444859.1 hypothetical protein [Streptomyces sp. DSM 41886]
MTTTTHSPAATTADPRARRRRDARPFLGGLAIAACVPYLTLKIAWLAGSHVGIPEGSELRTPEGEDGLFAANAMTAVMDALVIVLVLALTRAWGRRLPAWLLITPLWVATGLLAPILVGFPSMALIEAFSGSPAGSGQDEIFLDPWVFTAVYTGFGVQALALGGLFTLYVRDRFGHLLSGRLAALAPAATAAAQRAGAGAAVLVLAFPAGMNALWLAGGTAGLSKSERGERDALFHLTSATSVLFALAAAAGVLLLAFRPRRLGGTRVFTAVAAAWVGGAATANWGGWLLMAEVFNSGAVSGAERATPLMTLVHTAEVTAGVLVLAVGAHLFAERAARAAAPRQAP